MKPTIVLLANTTAIAEIHSRMRTLGEYVEREFFDILSVGPCVVGVDGSNDVLNEYDGREIDELARRFGDVSALLVEYESQACLRAVLASTTHNLTGIVDDNFGKFYEFADYVDHLSSARDAAGEDSYPS